MTDAESGYCPQTVVAPGDDDDEPADRAADGSSDSAVDQGEVAAAEAGIPGWDSVPQEILAGVVAAATQDGRAMRAARAACRAWACGVDACWRSLSISGSSAWPSAGRCGLERWQARRPASPSTLPAIPY